VELLNQVTELLEGLRGSPWLWVLVLAIAGLDALLPFMPSETTVITVAVFLGPDPASLALLALVAALGALAGDCLGYWVGRTAGSGMIARLQRGPAGRQRYEWARERVDRHAVLLILAARYLPGGRVASSLATGSLRYPPRRFVPLDAAGAALWSCYSTLIGYVGGASFTGEPAKGLLLSFALGLALVGLVELVRRWRARLRSRRGAQPIHPGNGHPQRGAAGRGDRRGPHGDRADVS
jgi:membrane protein DedA with SNARE-associated domain